MDTLGIGYSGLSARNPRLIMTSITPFGQTGPYKDYKASDIVTSRHERIYVHQRRSGQGAAPDVP